MHDQMERLAQKDELIAQLRRRLDEQEEQLARSIEALAKLSQIVFGELGSEPNVYGDYDKLCELKREVDEALANRTQPVTKETHESYPHTQDLA